MKPVARVVLTAVALAAAFYARLFLGATWFDQWDLVVQELPRFDFLARTLQETGRFPFWDPHLWAGQPVLGMPQPGPLYPASLLLYLWPVENGHVPVVALNVYYVLIHVQALLLMYLLCRELAAPRAGAWIGGVLFSFGGVMGSSPWPDHLNGVVWAPGLAWVVVRIWRGKRPRWTAALGGLMLGLAWLSGHHEAPFWITLFVLAALLPRWRELAIVMALAGAMAAPQVVPSIDFGQRSRRFVETDRPLAWNERVPYEIHKRYSLTWAGLGGIVLPISDPQAGTMALTGTVGVMLALMGVRYSHLFLVVAAVGVIVSLGANTPIHGYIYQWIPMADKARVPVRAIFVTNLGLAALAALGCRRVPGRIQWILLGAAFGEMFLGSRERFTQPERVQLASWRSVHADLIGFLRELPKPVRVMVDPGALPVNLGDAEGIDQIYGILPVVSANMEQNELHTRRVQDLFAVTHAIGRGSDPGGGREIFRSRAGLSVFERGSPLARAWFARGAIQVETGAELRRRIQAVSFDLLTAMSTTTPPAVEECGNRVIAYRRPLPGVIDVEVRSGCRGWLVVSEAHDPGWEVAVNGERREVTPADEVLLGVAVRPGDERIRFRYSTFRGWSQRE